VSRSGSNRMGGGSHGRMSVDRRVRSLAMGEGAAALVFAWIAVKGGLGGGQANRLAIGLLVFFLAQGSAWWWTRLALLRSRRSAHRSTLLRRAVRALDLLNRGLLVGAVPAMLLLSSGLGDLTVGIAFFLFALVEYVNYFHIRLSYGRWGFNLREFWRTPLRPSGIRVLLARGEPRASGSPPRRVPRGSPSVPEWKSRSDPEART